MEFETEYILENEVVRLEPLSILNAQFLKTFSINEPELWTYSLVPASGLENLIRYVESALLGRESEVQYPFVVFDKRANKYAGCTRFYDYQKTHNTIQLGYTWYGKDFQGTGLNKNCKFLLLQFAFERIGIERVEFRADANNDRSVAAMKSIGCTVEGVLRNNCQGIGLRRDSIVLSILKEEWNDSVKDMLRFKINKESV